MHWIRFKHHDVLTLSMVASTATNRPLLQFSYMINYLPVTIISPVARELTESDGMLHLLLSTGSTCILD